MTSPGRESSRDIAAQGNIREKLWDLICCCRCSSTRSLTEVELPVFEPKQQSTQAINTSNGAGAPNPSSSITPSQQATPPAAIEDIHASSHPGQNSTESAAINNTVLSEPSLSAQNGETGHTASSATPPQPGGDNTNSHESDIDYIGAADSIVTFVLKAVENLGSNLPGIGAVSVVLEAKDKFMTDRGNREEIDEITTYIEDLCETARKYEGVEKPRINMDDDKFIAELKGFYKDMRISHGWRRTFDIVNAGARKKKLEDVWKGIDRAMKKRGLQVKVNAARMIENVLQKMTEMEKAFGDVHAELSATIDGLLGRLELSTAKGARYDSGRTEQTRLVSCTADTRVEVLEQIKDWATGAVGGEHFFWLNGLAGTGKSTIATTIAKWAQEETILGGSFFFSRNVEHLNSAARVFPTLAHQLALFDEQYKRALCDTLRTAGDVISANLETQFEALIRKPFAACRSERTILVMLDALDECSSEEDVKQMLRLLLQYDFVGSEGIKLRIFVTSRPESHIRLVFTSRDGTNRHEKVVLHDIDRQTVRRDIEKYLTEEFGKMCLGDFERKPPKDWPSFSDFEKLLDKCGAFFAYAATVVRFVGDAGVGYPVRQLADILGLMENPAMTVSTNPYNALDNLYLAVLEQAARKDPHEDTVARIVHVIVTVICLRRPMSVRDLALFLGMTSDNVRYTLRHLHSIILVPDGPDDVLPWSDSIVQFFHQSFPDFLKDQKRCPPDKGFVIDIAGHEQSMASRCIDLNSLHGVARYGPVFEYAVANWMYHFQSKSHPDIIVPTYKRSLWPVTTGDELGEEIARLEREPQAEFDKPWSERFRKDVLDTVQDWFGRNDDSKHMFWLNGWANRGRPNIGMYIAKWAREEQIPGACILLDTTPMLHVLSIFPFLASQLARFDPGCRSALYDVIQRDQGILSSQDYHTQFETLVRQPMARSNRHERTIQQPILLILDALDAVGFEGNNIFILRTLLHPFPSARAAIDSNLRVLVVSKPRPEYHALLNPRSSESPVILYEFDERMDRSSIQTFLEDWLEGHERALSNVQVEKLLDCCGTSFTFARTAIRFVFNEEVGDPNGQLREIFSIDERLPSYADGGHRPVDLDDLYRLVLQGIASKNPEKEVIERVRCFIATIICLRRTNWEGLSLPPEALVIILAMEEDHIRAIRQMLSCVEGDTDAKGDLCSSLHPSFEEFIQDKERCTDSRFLVDVPAHERFMTLRCCSKIRDGPIQRSGDFDYAYHYSVAHWPSHLRSALYHNLCGDFVQELDITGLLRDRNTLAESHSYQHNTSKIVLGDDVDIIPFLREVIEKYQPKEAETILALLRDAEADEEVAVSREDYLGERKRLLGDRASQTDLGVQYGS